MGVGCEYTIVKGVGCRNTMVKGVGCGNTMVNALNEKVNATATKILQS